MPEPRLLERVRNAIRVRHGDREGLSGLDLPVHHLSQKASPGRNGESRNRIFPFPPRGQAEGCAFDTKPGAAGAVVFIPARIGNPVAVDG